jgi:lipid A 4'-phosphatase
MREGPASSGEPSARLCRRWIAGAILGLGAAGLVLAAWPALDLAASQAFFRPGRGFLLASEPGYDLVRTTYELVRPAARWLVAGFGAAALLAGMLAVVRGSAVAGIRARGWAFLLVALLVGPGLLVNAVLKESWGRARPDDVTLFGGNHQFSAALTPSNQCHHNCSFVAGDPSLGFFLQAFGYVGRRRQRAWLLGGLAAGGAIGLFRMALGAHFLSDVIFSGVVILLSTAAVHAVLFRPGRRRLSGAVRVGATMQGDPAAS